MVNARPSIRLVTAVAVLAGCGVTVERADLGPRDLAVAPVYDLTQPAPLDLTGWDGKIECVEGQKGCYTVYAHGDHFLYKVDLANKDLVAVGPFDAPLVTGSDGKKYEDVITDLAVSPTDEIWCVSHTKLYTADPKDGHVTVRGSVTDCGVLTVALSFAPDGKLYAGDYKGAFCRIDFVNGQARVVPIGQLGDGLALAGDIVVVGDGTMYGTAVRIADGNNGPSALSNILVKLDPATGTATQIGATSAPRLYGVAYSLGKVFGFTHTGSGDVFTIDPRTGQSTKFNTFKDPTTNLGIAFAGAGVNPMVAPNIQ